MILKDQVMVDKPKVLILMQQKKTTILRIIKSHWILGIKIVMRLWQSYEKMLSFSKDMK